MQKRSLLLCLHRAATCRLSETLYCCRKLVSKYNRAVYTSFAHDLSLHWCLRIHIVLVRTRCNTS